MLATSYINSSKLLKIDSEEQKLELFDSIISNKLVLIAYDCDFNFEPCFKNGLKAHWALIHGFYTIVDLSKILHCSQSESENVEVLNGTIIDLKTSTFASEIIEQIKENYKKNASINDNGNFRDLVYCICRHGKSKHCGVGV